jgi:hypothetical protein
MGRKWEDADDPVDAALRILVVTYSLERMIQTVRGSAMELMRRVNRQTDTASSVSGMPCAGAFAWTGTEADEEEILTHKVAPPDDSPLSMHDEPPSRPV